MKKHLLSIFALGTAFVLYPTLATAQEELPPPPPMEEMAPPPPPNEFTLSAQLQAHRPSTLIYITTKCECMGTSTSNTIIR